MLVRPRIVNNNSASQSDCTLRDYAVRLICKTVRIRLAFQVIFGL